MQQQNLDNVFNIILNQKYRWLFHIIFWLIVFSVDISTLTETEIKSEIKYTIVILFLEMIVVYFNIYFLFSRFLVKGKIYRYLFFTLLTIIIYISVNHLLFFEESTTKIIDDNTSHAHITTFTSSLIAFSFRMFSIIGTAVGIKFFKRYFIEQKKLNAIKQDSLENELLYLKNQINPHFLFNSLNNIYVLSKKNLSTTSDSILLLSDLLRYQLYDCTKNKVLLSNEIKYLRNFLRLEELRKSNNKISLQIEGQTKQTLVAPFLFMPFVENAIKYSTQTEHPIIEIKFVLKDSFINFNIENNKIDTNIVKENSGIGLKNVKRRLDLLYPNLHELTITETKHHFKLSLKLKMTVL